MSDRLNTRQPGTITSQPERIEDIALGEAQIQARAAWYYYIGGLTQQEIADKLGITRLRVNRIVGQARADGLVHVDIMIPLANCVAYEERLKEHYGLKEVSVVPAVDDYDMLLQIIGEAASVMLQPKLRDGIKLGLSWGRSLSAVVKRLKPVRYANSRVTGLMGGMTRGSAANTFEVCSEFARVMGSECSYVCAPIFCPSESSRETLISHLGIADVFKHAANCDVAVVECGKLTSKLLVNCRDIDYSAVMELHALGAVGGLLGTFLDAKGAVVDHPMNRKVMAMDPALLRAVPHSILIAGGRGKSEIVRAVLNGGYVNSLVTDASIAEALLA